MVYLNVEELNNFSFANQHRKYRQNVAANRKAASNDLITRNLHLKCAKNLKF